MTDVYILDAVRTPFGRYGGALSGIRPDDLAAHVLRALAERSPGLDPAAVDDVFFGDANGAGEDNRNVARMAALLAGWPTSVPGVTLNRLCGSGMESVIAANRAIAVGDASLAVAGGVESMSRAPWVLPKPAQGFPTGHETLYSTTLGWRMVNPAMPEQWTVSLGESTEQVAATYGISRAEQDAFALRSQARSPGACKDVRTRRSQTRRGTERDGGRSETPRRNWPRSTRVPPRRHDHRATPPRQRRAAAPPSGTRSS